MKILGFSTLLFFKITFFPSTNLMLWMLIAIVLDFVTGFAKAVATDKERTSKAFRQTIIKFLQYGGALAVSMIIGNTASENKIDGLEKVMTYANDGLVIFIIYIEMVSILENLLIINGDSLISKYLFKPLHKLLTLAIKKNPINKTTGAAIMIVCLMSCSASKHLPIENKTVIKDSIVFKTDTVKTTQKIFVLGETVKVGFAIPCPEASNVSFAKKQGNTSVLVQSDDKGNFTVDCKTDSMQLVIDSLITVTNDLEKYHNEVQTITITKIENVVKFKVPKWCWWLLGINVCAVAFRFRNPIGSFFKGILKMV
jgi:Bacteriophage holin family